MNNGNYDLVLFDFDGTVADTGAGIFPSARYAAAKMGYPEPDDETLHRFVGPPLLVSFQGLLGMTEAEAQQAVTHYRAYYSEKAMLNLTLYPGIRAVFEQLRARGVKTGIASSKPERFAVKIVAHLGMTGLIDVFSCPQDDREDESKQMLIERAMRQLSTAPDRTAMVGDRLYDMIGAVRAGVTAIGAAYGYGGAEELRAAGAAYLIDTPSALLPLVFNGECDPNNI